MTIFPTKLLGDCRDTLKTLSDKSVHMCVTSPPYWGLRSYLPAGHPMKHLEIGREPTIEQYIEHILQVFREVWRVLRDDATLWLNLGDSYANDTKWGGSTGGKHVDGLYGESIGRGKRNTGLKAKDLCMVPFRVAMALQAEGWYLRSVIPWVKRNAMPESCQDRPASAVEYVFLLSKSERYYYDRHAVVITASPGTHARLPGNKTHKATTGYANGTHHDHRAAGLLNYSRKMQEAAKGVKNNPSMDEALSVMPSSRNRRNSDSFFESWQGLYANEEGEPLGLIVNPVGTRIKHFASYPPKLVEPFIKVGTSEKGCCPGCGAPWERITEQVKPTEQVYGERSRECFPGRNGEGVQKRAAERPSISKGTGWEPSCDCPPADSIPCTVLDPFWGTGCTGMVATKLGRQSIGCELNPEYFESSSIRDGQGGLL